MITDNNRYFNVVIKENSYDGPEVELNIYSEPVKQILENKYYTDAQKYVLRLYLGLNKDNLSLLPEVKKTECYFLRVLNQLYNDNYEIEEFSKYDIFSDLKKSDGSLNLSKAKTTYITSDKISHNITHTIRMYFFNIINVSFNDLLGCKYEFDFYKASLLSNNLLNLVSGDRPILNESANLYLNIDPTGTGATLSPLYYTIWKHTNVQEDCSEELKNYKAKEINKINDKLILSQVDSNVKLLITYANKWDASNDDELTAIAKNKFMHSNIIYTKPQEVNNIRFQITFGTPDIFLEYQFEEIDTGKTALKIYKFCGTKLSDISIVEGEGSVLNLANKIKETHDTSTYTVYKTCGDFLQFFTLKLREQKAIHEARLINEQINNLSVNLHDPRYSAQIHNEINNLKQHEDEIYTMLSQDLTGMDIGSLFVFNMVGCMHSGDKLKGLNLFLSNNIIKYIQKENKDYLKILYEVANPSFPRTIQSEWMKDDEDDSNGSKRKRARGNQFSKYKYKKSKSKKPKPKSKNTSKKLEKLKKEALKMGLSKSSLKQGMTKLQKNVTKLKSLAKKYRLKINKKLITNIKKCIKIHDKAKKLKIKLTKTTKSGKRLYKTPSELLKEIKSKMKQNKKTKYSRKTKQNKHSKKR